MWDTWSVNIVGLTHSTTVNRLCVNIADHLVGELLYKINHFYYHQPFVSLLFLPPYSSNWLQW